MAEGIHWFNQKQVPSGPWTNCGRDKVWFVGCLGSEPRLAQSQTWRCATFIGRLGETATTGERNAGRASTLHRIPRYLPYNWGKITEKPQSGYPKGARLTCAERDSCSRPGHCGGWPAGRCRPWLSRQPTGSTLGQRKYLQSCRTRYSPYHLMSCRTRGFSVSANEAIQLQGRAVPGSEPKLLVLHQTASEFTCPGSLLLYGLMGWCILVWLVRINCTEID